MRKRIVFLLVVLLLCSLSVGVCGAKAAENYNLRLLEGLDIVCGLSEDKLERFLLIGLEETLMAAYYIYKLCIKHSK